MRAVAAAAVLAAGAALLPWLGRTVQPMAYEGGRVRDETARAVRNTSAAAVMLGDLRATAADLLFNKTEAYLHSGVAYMPHLDEELRGLTAVTEAIDEHQSEVGHDDHDHFDDHAGTPTMIPDPSRDFRGWIGRMHREVHPWRDPSKPHVHTDGTELLPWFRLMTLADPHHVRGFAVGSWWLKAHRPDHAVGFIEEGIRNNPEAFALHLMLGQILLAEARKMSDFDMLNPVPEALPLVDRARVAYAEAARLVLRTRPEGYDPDGPPVPGWTDDDENDAMAAVHMAALTERQYGDREKARDMARHYLAYFPRSGTLQRIAR